MKWFLLAYVIAWFLAIFFEPIRLTLLHPVKTIRYAVVDLYYFFKYKKWNNYTAGRFVCFDAGQGVVFGSGKTLSVVHQVLSDYKKYNNKQVYDVYRKKFVTQKIQILTNLSLNYLPYEKMTSLGQIVQIAERYHKLDAEQDTLTCIVVLIDETQNQLHCRSFKDNLSPMMLKSLTECRHFNMSIYYDAPRFNQVDALLRQCTSEVIKCKKIWRWQCLSVFDAADLENASNIQLVRRLRLTGFFIENSLFEQYDTKEIIDNLTKAKERGDFLSDTEILALQCNSPTDIEAISHKSSKLKKKQKVGA